MLLGWLDARRATEIGISLAEQFAAGPAVSSGPDAASGRVSPSRKRADGLRNFLQRAEREVRALPLNFYKRAKLANAFKWRLLEKGVASNTAAEVTQTLVMHLSMNRLTGPAGDTVTATPPELEPSPNRGTAAQLLTQADRFVESGAYAEAAEAYEASLKLKPRQIRALNNLGATYWKLGRYQEAEQQFRNAIRVQPKDADAHGKLGGLLRARGELAAAENSLRRALKLQPHQLEARVALGWALIDLGRLAEATRQFDKALKLSPRHAGSLLGLARVARDEGRFGDAETTLQQILASNPQHPDALAAMVELRDARRP
jgi:Tfp pilus assembly protein PilF